MCSLLPRLKFELLHFSNANDGNIALIFGITLPVLIGVVGLGTDSAAVYNQQSRMQSVADSTALAVGNEMNLLLEDPDTLKQSGMDRADGVNLVINADYAASDVPVPPGLGPKSTSVRLSK